MATELQPRRNLWQRVWSTFDPNERYLKRIQPLAEAIGRLEPEFEKLSQQDLQDRLRKIRGRVEEARLAALQAQAELPPAEDSDTRRRRHKEVVDAEKAILDEHLVEVFAAVREAAKRTLSMRHFDVQMLGGIVLHDGRIAEMKTGEGKTLTATCPLVLNALAGRGAHVVTVNDYLARRDAEWMGKIYRYLGLSVGVIQHDMSSQDRQVAYQCDITYITNHEIGFDYLRDHSSTWRPEHLVIRELHYAIVDEVDSILIDEARVPLIISASRGKPVEKYRKVQEVVARLVQGEQDFETKETTGDFYVDEKAKNATLTEDGQRKVEIALGIDNLNDSAHIEDNHLVNAALKANFCYKRDTDYIVGPGDGGVPSVIIVDSFTGRPQPGRRWSDGLHQAIEAKERVPVQDEQQTIATVTYQNFFLMYNRLSGMTGTAKTEEPEFVEVYNVPVVVIPTNRPMVRREHADIVYKTEEWKLRGICCEIVGYYCRRQPILVGTRSVEMSERISARLRADKMRLTLQLLLLQWHIMENEKRLDKTLLRQVREASTVPLESLKPREVQDFLKAFNLDPAVDSDENVKQLLAILEVTDEEALREVLAHGVVHEVLNARHHEREAQIVAQAGRLGAVTIATNMAGRGTDIVLGGNPEPDVEELLIRRGVDPKSLAATLFINQALKGDGEAARAQAEEQGGLPEPVLREIAAIRAAWRAEQQDVLATGGLHILGTERHESRRIDNQLRGRSGRQGDPGSSRFYISLQDELMRLFGPDRWSLLMNQWPEEQPVEAKLITRAMNNAQRKVEARNFDQRKTTLRYDDVMNVQRQHIYAERRRILEGVDLRTTVSHMMGDLVDELMVQFLPADAQPEEWDLQGLWAALNQRFPLKDQLAYEDLLDISREALAERLRAAADRAYDDKENDFISSVVQFELQTNIHEVLQQAPDRDIVCQALNTLWPLSEYLPARLRNLPDTRVPEALYASAREALEAGPRTFIQAVVRDRLGREADAAAELLAAGHPAEEVAARLQSQWPVRLEAAGLAEAADAAAIEALLTADLDQQGWGFVTQALQRQMGATVDLTLPKYCDLVALVDSLDALWPLGGGLKLEQLESCNFGVIDERLRRMASMALEQAGYDFVRQAAEHRLRWLVEHAPEADPAWLQEHLAAIMPASERVDAQRFVAEPDSAVAELTEPAEDGVVLRAVEEVAVTAVVDAHRQMSLNADLEGEEEEELAFGDLQSLVARLNQQWAFGEALNPWELERLPVAEVRREMAEAARAHIRLRGRDFVSETADLRLSALVRQAIQDHASLSGLCARLNQQFELPAVFSPDDYREADGAAELVQQLSATAAAELEEEPERYEAVARAIPVMVSEGFSLKRLCERLNQELSPPRKLDPRDLGEVEEEELEAAILERLAGVEERFEERFVTDAVRQHIDLSIDAALDRYYDLRGVSTEVAAAWPLRPDAVKASKLKGWNYNELAKRIKEVLVEAWRWEEWRFTRRFVMRLLEQGLAEAAARYCPPGAQRAAWDLPALCAELAERWPLEEAPDPRSLPDFSRDLTLDELMGLARRAYGLQERSFLRETARHRFGQQLEQVRREHYSLERAALEVNQRWGLGQAIEPLALAEVREADGRALEELTRPLLEAAEESFYQIALNHWLIASVDESLERHYNAERLLGAVLGGWPLPHGGLQADTLRAVPQKEMVERIRQTLHGATGPLQRRLLFHNLRQATTELDPAALSADPRDWRLQALVADLNQRLPFENAVRVDSFAADLLRRAMREPLDSAAQALGSRPEALAEVVRRSAADRIEVLLHAEGRPNARCERVAAIWPVADRLNPEALKGQNTPQVRTALNSAVNEAYAADPRGFVAGATRLWLTRTVDETLEQHWPTEGRPGPWVLAEVVEALNQRWGHEALLHPTDYKGLEREELRDHLLAAAGKLETGLAAAQFTRELGIEVLGARLGEAAVDAVGTPDDAWDLGAVAANLAAFWPGETPTADELAARLTHAVVREQLNATAERLESRLVAEYETEAIKVWMDRRLAKALEETSSLSALTEELTARWPIGELDTARMATLTYSQMREALASTAIQIAAADGSSFVAEAARRWADLEGREPADAALVTEFRRESVRRRLRQAVGEAQQAHCNPEIASERWDVPAFVAALERDWPVDGALDPAVLGRESAAQLRAHADAALLAAFEAQPEEFVAATTARQVAQTVRDALATHASLERLAEVLTAFWPRDTSFSADSIRERLAEELPATLAELVRAGGGEAAEAELEAMAQAAGPRPDLVGLVPRLQGRWPELAELTAAELEERLVAEHLQTRLWEEFSDDPRSFVKAVALEDVPRQLERRLMLEAIDTNWCNHLEAMDYLKEGINLRGYAQTDPFIAYRKEGRTMFENMLGRIRETVVSGLFETTEHELVQMHSHGRLGLRIAVEYQNVQETAAKAEELTAAQTAAPVAAVRRGGERSATARPGAPAAAPRAPVVVEKVGRNDPCPCGSGRKYKHCCGR